MTVGLRRTALAALFAAEQALASSPAQNDNRASTAGRLAMVEEQIAARGVTDQRVLAAMRTVPRDRFVPGELASRAYEDRPLPIGHDQTISQPYVVAYMTEALGVQRDHKVLEIGTGSGYQAAVLAELGAHVYTIEIVPELARQAAATLRGLGYAQIHVRDGDGYAGWPEEAPFDRIMVTAAPADIPKPLIDQLALNGRMVIPVGEQGRAQWLTVLDKTPQGVIQRRTLSVSFVPFRRSR